jgi:UDP-N-acetyl-2-amino-2-deoxyglucuronate dehydrogenase
LKFILIGCGHIAKKHITEIRQAGELVAVCDPNEKNIASLDVDQDAIAIYKSSKELFTECPAADAIVICAPSYLHAELSIQALSLGYHVLCEKPMALNQGDAERMITIADQYSKALTIVKQIRYTPGIQALKDWVQSGKSGRIFSVSLHGVWNRNTNYYEGSDWRGAKEKSGGILFTQFSHFIDLLIWLFGEIKQVASFQNNINHIHQSDFEDQLVSSFTFASGAIGSALFSTNSFRKNLETGLSIVAENGNVKLGGIYADRVEWADTLRNDFIVKDSPTPVFSTVYNYFSEEIKSGHFNRQNLRDACRTIALIEKMYST